MPKAYIGPKAQAHVPDEEWRVIQQLKEVEGYESDADAVRAVIAAGCRVIRSQYSADQELAAMAKAGAR